MSDNYFNQENMGIKSTQDIGSAIKSTERNFSHLLLLTVVYSKLFQHFKSIKSTKYYFYRPWYNQQLNIHIFFIIMILNQSPNIFSSKLTKLSKGADKSWQVCLADCVRLDTHDGYMRLYQIAKLTPNFKCLWNL